jgi:hypothetical protein
VDVWGLISNRYRGDFAKHSNPQNRDLKSRSMSPRTRDDYHRTSREYIGTPAENRSFSTRVEAPHRMNAPQAPLPSGWGEMLSNKGEIYYYNNLTGESSWNRPAGQSHGQGNTRSSIGSRSSGNQGEQKDVVDTHRTSKTRARPASKDNAAEGTEWWKDRNTPFKTFRRAFSSLKTVETDLSADDGGPKLNVLGWKL